MHISIALFLHESYLEQYYTVYSGMYCSFGTRTVHLEHYLGFALC